MNPRTWTGPIWIAWAALVGCQFDDAAFAHLATCASQVDCAAPEAPFCVAGRCVPGDPAVALPGEGEGEGEGEGSGEGEGEGEGEAPPPGDPPIAVLDAPDRAALGDSVPLNASQSVGRGLVLTWTVTGPDGEETEVRDGADSRATFVAGRRGAWRVGLRVHDDVGRTDVSQDREIEVRGFEVLERTLDALDVDCSADGETAWMAASGGAHRASLAPADEDDPGAARPWEWVDYTVGDVGTDRVATGPIFAWFARTTTGALRVRRVHEAGATAATAQALPGVLRVHALATSPTGHVWLGGEEGLGRTRRNEGGSLFPPLDLPGTRRVLALHATPEALWVGRSEGVCRILWSEETDLECAREVALLDADHLITALAEDGTGGLWVGTDAQGLYRVAPDDLVQAFAQGQRGVPQGRLDDLASDPSGDVWGVGEGVVFRIYAGDEPVIRRFEAATGLAVLGAIRAVAVGSEGGADVWVVGERGAGRLDR